MIGLKRRLIGACTAVAVLIVTSNLYAVRRAVPEASLKQMTEQSDSVVIGKCLNKKGVFLDGIIATEYEVEVSENLKGKQQVGEKLVLLIPGGDLDSGLSMHSPVHAQMYEGEKVALFVQAAKPAPATRQARSAARKRLVESPQIYGGYEGKFSVFTDKVDGREKITRLRLDQFGYVHKDRVLERILGAIASGDMKVTSGPAVDLGGGLTTTPDGKAMLDRLVTEAGLNPSPKATPVPTGLPAAAARTGLPPVEDFESFKSQVRQYATK